MFPAPGFDFRQSERPTPSGASDGTQCSAQVREERVELFEPVAIELPQQLCQHGVVSRDHRVDQLASLGRQTHARYTSILGITPAMTDRDCDCLVEAFRTAAAELVTQ